MMERLRGTCRIGGTGKMEGLLDQTIGTGRPMSPRGICCLHSLRRSSSSAVIFAQPPISCSACVSSGPLDRGDSLAVYLRPDLEVAPAVTWGTMSAGRAFDSDIDGTVLA